LALLAHSALALFSCSLCCPFRYCS
jgi:hypothetical protein